MTSHPLLLSTPMVLAFLAGRKRVTRRIPTCANSLVDGRRVSGKTWKDYDFDMSDYVIDPGPSPAGNYGPYFKIRSRAYDTRHRIYPIYQPGDKIWFRETWAPSYKGDKFFYKADYKEDYKPDHKWRPSIHMPKSACRLWADCGTVTCEHLNDITEEQAKKEGLACITKDGGRTYKYGIPDRDGYPGTDDYGWHWQDWDINPVVAFKMLWQSIHGPDSWSANPPVYAINFNPTTRKP